MKNQEKNLLKPGCTIGILGGGQLGRMLCQSASRLGFKTFVWTNKPNECATYVASQSIVAPYTDVKALKQFVDFVNVATYEFENIPSDLVETINHSIPVYPSPDSLRTIQDRLTEKLFVSKLGINVSPFVPVETLEDLKFGVKELGTPCVLKTRRMGYDGKGQHIINSKDECYEIWNNVKLPSILEKFVDFSHEASVIVCRSLNGNVCCYEPSINIHKNHILHESIVPANFSEELKNEIFDIAKRIVNSFNYVGVMGVELFLLNGKNVFVNELAPRVHNSGHWTLDGANTSQFEQHIRCICGWPLGSVDLHSGIVMQNLLGDEINKWEVWANNPGAKLHIYDKGNAVPGRKMGHVNIIEKTIK